MPVFSKGKKHFLFVHIPKTGGTSIEKCFQDNGFRISYRDVGGKLSLNSIRKCSPQHMHAELLEQTFNLSSFEGIFMLVRDPLSRVRSEFGMRNHNTYKGDNDHFHRWFSKTLRTYSEDKFVYDNHFRPQSDFYIQGASVYKLESGMSSIIQEISNDFELGLEYEDIPHTLNREKQSGFSTKDVHVGESLQKKIEFLYKDDYRNFNY